MPSRSPGRPRPGSPPGARARRARRAAQAAGRAGSGRAPRRTLPRHTCGGGADCAPTSASQHESSLVGTGNRTSLLKRWGGTQNGVSPAKMTKAGHSSSEAGVAEHASSKPTAKHTARCIAGKTECVSKQSTPRGTNGRTWLATGSISDHRRTCPTHHRKTSRQALGTCGGDRGAPV